MNFRRLANFPKEPISIHMSAVLSAVDDFGQDRQVAQLRIPPHSIESESSVLGGLLLDNSAWDRVGDLLVEGAVPGWSCGSY